MENPTQFVRGLLRLPEGKVIPAGTDLTPYYRNWGFTIYRTAYGTGSDQHWQNIINKIKAQVSEDTLGAHPNDVASQQALDLFSLDPRSEPATLNGLDLERVRQLYKDGVGGQPMGADDTAHRNFLLVDEEVIESNSVNELWVKCVQVDYVEEGYSPRNPRIGLGQRYSGWMKVTIRSVPQLWQSLELESTVQIAPQTIGGAMLTVWGSISSY